MVGHYLPNKTKTCYNIFFTLFQGDAGDPGQATHSQYSSGLRALRCSRKGLEFCWREAGCGLAGCGCRWWLRCLAVVPAAPLLSRGRPVRERAEASSSRPCIRQEVNKDVLICHSFTKFSMEGGHITRQRQTTKTALMSQLSIK
jgi:hypothetical protein